MPLTTKALHESAEKYLEDDNLVFTGPGGTYQVECGPDGSSFILREGTSPSEETIARLFDRVSAELIASHKARGLY